MGCDAERKKNNNNYRNLCNIKIDMSFARNILYSSLLYILLRECQLYFEIAILFLVLCYI